MLKATAIAILLPCSAFAQSQCAPHADVVADGYGETRRSIALGANNTVVETFASEGGSWTITVTTPGWPTCLVAAGQAWQATNDPLPNDDQGT
jgi:NAD(P)H-dependent flavin oxidoreductase YrpB (nitropropane dioxygenase family)